MVLNISVKGISYEDEALGPALVDFERISIKMLSEWRIISTLVSIYKNKGDSKLYKLL